MTVDSEDSHDQAEEQSNNYRILLVKISGLPKLHWPRHVGFIGTSER